MPKQKNDTKIFNMKKYIVLALATVIICSCGSYQVLPRKQITRTSFMDYRPYAEAGFFFTPNDYAGKYTPIGQLYIVVQSQISVDNYSDYFTTYLVPKETPISSQDLLDLAMATAIEKGANGICNFKVEVITENYVYAKNESGFAPTYKDTPANKYIISGFCIHIID